MNHGRKRSCKGIISERIRRTEMARNNIPHANARSEPYFCLKAKNPKLSKANEKDIRLRKIW
jgi:hypothetical protein